MDKQKASLVFKILPLAGILFAVIALITMAAPYLAATFEFPLVGTTTAEVSGFALAFGGQGAVATASTVTTFDVKAVAGITTIFVMSLIGLVLIILPIAVSKLPGKPIFVLVALAFFLIVAILAFSAKSLALASLKEESEVSVDFWKLGGGAIASGILFLLGGLLMGTKLMDLRKAG